MPVSLIRPKSSFWLKTQILNTFLNPKVLVCPQSPDLNNSLVSINSSRLLASQLPDSVVSSFSCLSKIYSTQIFFSLYSVRVGSDEFASVTDNLVRRGWWGWAKTILSLADDCKVDFCRSLIVPRLVVLKLFCFELFKMPFYQHIYYHLIVITRRITIISEPNTNRL